MGQWTQLTNDKLSTMLDDLSKDDNFSSWKLSDRTNEVINKIRRVNGLTIRPMVYTKYAR